MSLDALNSAAQSLGGSWVKLNDKNEHPPVEGEIVDFEIRDRTDMNGDIVYKKGTTTARKEWVITLRVDDSLIDDPNDDGLRKLSLNESGQRAVAAAIKEAGVAAETGGVLKIGVAENAPDKFSQATYRARYTPPAKPLAIPADDTADDDLDDF